MNNHEKGITLIALIITIIVLLILAGITISLLTGENGLLNKANESKIITDETSVLEAAILYDNSNIGISAEKDESCIYSSPFDYILTDEVKKYIEKRLGRELISSDTFYKINTDKLNKDTEDTYIINEERNLVIKITKEQLAKLEKGKSIWFWCNMNSEDESIYVTNANKTVEVLDKLKEESVINIYIPIDRRKTEQYQNFVTEATKRGMYVYALEGDPAFVFEEEYSSCINGIIDNIVDYNNKVPKEARIRGVHYDVEAYGNTGYADSSKNWINGQSEEAKNGNVRKLYMKFVKQSSEYARKNGLKTEYDIPFTYNRFTYYDENGEEKNMAEDIVKYADKTTIMVYTTNQNYIFESLDKMKEPYTETDGSILQSEKSWMRIANENQKAIEVGVELDVFKNEAENLKNHPEYAGVYIDPNYEYTWNYINNTILGGTTEKIDNYDKENNYKTEYTYCIHHIYPFLRLIGYLN